MNCTSCGFRSTLEKGIPFFAQDYEKTFVDHTSEAVRNLIKNAHSHFWMIARRKIISDTIVKYLGTGDMFLEVGSGPADVSADLRHRGIAVTVSDIQIDGLIHAINLGNDSVVQFDVYRPIYLDHFDAVGAFDVIEHLENDLTAVRNMLGMVKPGGLVFVTVPAHSWLWNNRDRMESHKRRYSKRHLQTLFNDAGGTIIEVHYLFFVILPLLILRAIFDRFRKKEKFDSTDRANSMRINPLINWLLLKFMNAEIAIFGKRSPPIGGTLMLVARKNNR